MARSGKLLPDDLVSQPGAKQWHPAGSIRGLFNGASPTSVPHEPPQSIRLVPSQAKSVAVQPDAVTTPAPVDDAVRQTGGFTTLLLSLPKPILFGLFGGLGGLLGAVLLAELLWLLLKPAEAKMPPLQVAVPEVVRTYVGGRNTFLVKIARQRFKGPVKVETSSATDLSIPAVSISPEKDEGKVEVQTRPTTPLGKSPLTVSVSAPEDGTIKPVEAKLQLSVEPMPPTLAVAVSREVVVEQGGKGRFTVRIARDRFNENVDLQFAGAPPDINLPRSVFIRAGKSDTTVDLSAAPGAPLTKVPVTVKASADAGGQTIGGDAVFNLVVKERSPPAVDVVFVLDLTGSMQFAINGIKQGIQSFTEQMAEKKLDARFGLVGFRDIQDDREWPFALEFGGSAFTRDYREFRDKMAPLVARDGGDEPESSLQGVALAARLPFRPNAARVLILITDAPPKIHSKDLLAEAPLRPHLKDMPSTVAETVTELKKHEIDQMHLVVYRRHLDSHFKELQEDSKGKFFDLADSTTGSAFADLLPVLSRDISKITISSPPKAATKASEPPPLPEARSSAPPPETAVPTLKAVQSDQAFAAKDNIRLLIAIMMWTMVVAGAISLLLLAGQQFHARQSWVSAGEGSWAVLGGVVAGLIGGGIGQLVFQSTASPAASWEWLSRILGWSFLGSLIGGLLAFFVPNLKWYRGMLGGLAGGIFGAVAFLLVNVMMGSLLGRWLGAAILGFCLGLMVALAELAFRRFWLEIAVSPREVRTITLGSTAISLGSDERRASFFIAGVAPVALRYWVDGNEVCCEDAQTGATTLIAPGECRKVGRVTVTMRSVAASRRTGYELALIGGQSLQLQEGMPLTAEDLPGLEPKGADGMVALVSAQPNRPQEVLLRNRSKQSWTAWDTGNKKQIIEPGRGVELADGVEVDFGQVAGIIQRAEERERVKR
jgi:hypothetical protein